MRHHKLEWTHAQCDHCWTKAHPDKPAPSQAQGDGKIACCFCGLPIWTIGTIYVRADPSGLNCEQYVGMFERDLEYEIEGQLHKGRKDE